MQWQPKKKLKIHLLCLSSSISFAMALRRFDLWKLEWTGTTIEGAMHRLSWDDDGQ